MHPWHDLEARPSGAGLVNVVVEIPKGSRHKYEIDKATGVFRLDRVLYSAVHYPCDYGIVPRSLYDDGDPFDVLVVTHLPTFTGCLVEARPVALFRMRDRGLPDDKVLAVSHRDPSFAEVRDVSDLPAHLLREIEHFFRVYKELEGHPIETDGWAGVADAQAKVDYAIGLYREKTLARPGS